MCLVWLYTWLAFPGAGLAERAPDSAPARRDEAAWKSTVLGLFGTFKQATGAGLDLVDPGAKDSFRGGGGARIGPYRAPAASTPEGEVRPCVRAVVRPSKRTSCGVNGSVARVKA